jgi:hypothetical protein
MRRRAVDLVKNVAAFHQWQLRISARKIELRESTALEVT